MVLLEKTFHTISQLNPSAEKEAVSVMMGYVYTMLILLSLLSGLWLGNGPQLAAAALEGAQQGLTVTIAMGGSICLWSGVGNVMEASGLSAGLARLLMPLIARLYPSARTDATVAGADSANMTANFLGLGNAATPMGIQAVHAMAHRAPKGAASDEMCRLIVLNTASIQLIPATVAALRSSLGCASPFDILPAVWVTSVLSVTAGLLSAFALGRIWK